VIDVFKSWLVLLFLSSVFFFPLREISETAENLFGTEFARHREFGVGSQKINSIAEFTWESPPSSL